MDYIMDMINSYFTILVLVMDFLKKVYTNEGEFCYINKLGNYFTFKGFLINWTVKGKIVSKIVYSK